MSHGAGWVEQIVIDQPGVSSFFTPLSICINVDSWEHLEFDTRPDQLIAYTLVQGDERVALEFTPTVHSPEDEPVQQSLRLDPLSQYIQMELSVADEPGGARRQPRGSRRRRLTRPGIAALPRFSARPERSSGVARVAFPTMFERTQLPGGPRVISAAMPGTRSLSIAVTVLVGSRHERRSDSGLAHFMEHITFRGTQAMPSSRAVSEAVEGVGGTSNASTDRETTVYWVRLPVRHAELAFDVLSELLVRPLLRDEDVLRERDIIVEEIRSYRDDPSTYVYDLFDRSFYGDTPLGWEIAGDEASVATLDGPRIRAFWQAGYQPSNMVVAVAGDLSHERAVQLVARGLRDRRGRPRSVAAGHGHPVFAAERVASTHRPGAPVPRPAIPASGPSRPVDPGAARRGARRRILLAPVPVAA